MTARTIVPTAATRQSRKRKHQGRQAVNGKWVYPQRTDGVFAIRFDGSQGSAAEIACALKLVVRHRISWNSDELTMLEIGSHAPIKVGEYVIIDGNHDLIEVINHDVYHEKYTER